MNTIQSYGMTNYLSKNYAVSFGNKERLIKIASDYAAREANGLDSATNKYVAAHRVTCNPFGCLKDNICAIVGKLMQPFRKTMDKPNIVKLTQVKGLKTSLETQQLTDFQVRLIEKARIALKDNKNVNLYTNNIGWGSYINPTSNPNMFLHVGMEDFQKMTDVMETMQRKGGREGVFELSILGSDKKAIIKIPAEELTRNMKTIDTSMQAGVHPFLIDMAKYLDKHPEAIKEVEANVGKLDLTSVDSSIMEKIKACK